ncbi:FAD/NAD-P-binding domain-containing protein [Auriscalpium vulgare]|uniref:FAD/NAD-P-binding domain-containing protein n=1 Tax=Auriscalpium vulgare TaxID=40419 RepID=A0ACB8SB19_9AGAM|nr:FAD/NAD-P-binding domain-containing protein [Auriscalpium vulgare]
MFLRRLSKLLARDDAPAATSPPSKEQPHANGNSPNVAPSKNAAEPNAASSFKAGSFQIDDYRPMKVVCIGAGYSGIIAGIRFAQKVSNLDLTIYEKAGGVGGTWWANRYPGLSCDIPSHSYQLTFEPNTQWSGFYAPGSEILAYLQRVVEKYKLMKYIRLKHELLHARWDEPTGKWHLRIRRSGGDVDEEFDDIADVLFIGTGSLSRWKWPDIEGLKEFGGPLVHSANWDVGGEGVDSWEDSVKDWAGKKVGVIGNGSSGIQIVAALQPRVAELTNFVRSKTWISASFSVTKLLEITGRKPESTDYSFTPEQLEKFKDPEYYREFRRAVEDDVNSVADVQIRGSEMQKAAAAAFKKEMEKKLADKPGLADKIIPQFSVCCRRLTPGPGYLEALVSENTTLETTPITRVTPTGVVLADGTSRPLDVIVCATGFNTTYLFPFPILGRGGQPLVERWATRAEAYTSVAVDGFPNLFFSLGPNSGVNSGSLLVILERQVEYAVKATLKLQAERLKSIEVKKEAMDDWREYMDEYFPKMVWTEDCNSWYKSADGKVVGLWPGTCLQAVRVLANPRWEDYSYELLDANGTQNRFFWLGDGMTRNEKTKTGDRAWYLNDEEVNIPPGE